MLQPCSMNTNGENMAQMSINTLCLETCVLRHKNRSVILGEREKVHLILNTVCESMASCMVLEFELRHSRKDT